MTHPSAPPRAAPLDLFALAEALGAIAVSAGPAIMEHYCRCSHATKSDGSPVTAADLAAEAVILPALSRLMPDTPILSEEQASSGNVPRCGQDFLLVDPLDGTREFIDRNGEFTVNIGLIAAGRPVAGAVYQPAKGVLWIGGGGRAQVMAVAPGASMPAEEQRREIRARSAPGQGEVALVSRSHLDPDTKAFLATRPCASTLTAGSALKFCMLAQGDGDVYPRFSPTMEWDTAAGHAVLAAAGGDVLAPDGGPLRYGKAEDGFRNGAFVAWGRRLQPDASAHA
ncbi:3'(2'),5'-bisphosphate nucleotidase CysQ [Alsobacter metallidurans]|uniref:3'(2'),5'-bisphosphate nucleotidase CysQ n=1 Tax=Alsobacter metallidurans TaxID=340221 RepID=A0A917I4H5_9HYPH|nr:3'(2'),5'-bisphosphate nucleotidase CysQ [Alsobacter metallidurans]GGH13460.1 3'(2'),5'-bisphosphate nucleotidase CysQ [Alsobacter metallidurans]